MHSLGIPLDLGGELVLLFILTSLVTWCMPASAQYLRFEALFQFVSHSNT